MYLQLCIKTTQKNSAYAYTLLLSTNRIVAKLINCKESGVVYPTNLIALSILYSLYLCLDVSLKSCWRDTAAGVRAHLAELCDITFEDLALTINYDTI